MSCHLATKGRAYQLLKKGTKLKPRRNPIKKYDANLQVLKRENEEEKKDDQ